MTATFGSFPWLKQTGGKLAWHHKLKLMRQAVLARAATHKRLKTGQKYRFREVADIMPPDSVIAREAMAIASNCSPAFLFNHCLRSYFWARLLDGDNRYFDDEAVFVALMLHDLGLTTAYQAPELQGHCFTHIGAQAAEELALRHQWSDKRAALAANAIALHLNIIIEDKHGKEAQMVRAGSGGDVAGLGLDVLAADQITAVVNQYPRLNMKDNMLKTLHNEAAQHPCCRTAFLFKKMGFADLIKNSHYFSE